MCVCVCVLFSSVYHFILFLSAGGFTLYNSPSVFRFFFHPQKFPQRSLSSLPKKTAIPALVNSWFASLLSLSIQRLILLGCWPRQPPVYSQFSLLLFKRTHKVERTRDQKAPLSLDFFQSSDNSFPNFCSNSYGEELFKMVTTIGLPKKANSKARTTCCCLSGFINLKIGLLEDVCLCVIEMCGLS